MSLMGARLRVRVGNRPITADFLNATNGLLKMSSAVQDTYIIALEGKEVSTASIAPHAKEAAEAEETFKAGREAFFRAAVDLVGTRGV